ncbi:MAG: tRNA epoxyqueuosine(34) reductase QueG [Saprospiraceae bacterium]|nr:tRNA epoxyqueuosine(34) reductase QueG [Saprospiraceae bacterium]MBK7738541.1 tRNA epoxyqueuosine(34) reductase QueG [Saprospiraceae bacterium]MBK7912887.1 tRNA epoxyqueuosine(34) reductase QueG [Saprospiraceae bacterium]
MHLDKKPLIDFINSFGFFHVGFARARYLEEESDRLEKWLNQSYQGEMNYLERYFDFRLDPQKLMPGCKTIIVLAMNYFQEPGATNENQSKISMYALGQDYHKVIRSKTKAIIQWMRHQYGDIAARAFVDSGPVLERVWAKESGISWTGKNTLSINPKTGSYFFLSCILTDLEFEADTPIKEYCGTCKKCIDACPTQAIHENGFLLDASKCISYLTIELKSQIPEEFKGKMDDWIFGCDVCQDVCPWNRFSRQTDVEDLWISDAMKKRSDQMFMEMNEDDFNQLFNQSAIKRTGLKGLQRNIRFIQ